MRKRFRLLARMTLLALLTIGFAVGALSATPAQATKPYNSGIGLQSFSNAGIAQELGVLKDSVGNLQEDVETRSQRNDGEARKAGTTRCTREAARNLDSRLGPLGVSIEEANVAPGQPYWRVVEIIWHDESQAGGRHSIFVDALDEAGDRAVGAPFTVSWGGGSLGLVVENKPFPEYGGNFPMYSAGNAYSLQMDGLPSDKVHGMGLGDLNLRDGNIHVEYLVKFQRTTKP